MIPWSTSYLGLDAGRHTLKVVCVRRRVGRIDLVGTATLPRIADRNELAHQLRALLHTRGWSYYPCVLGLPSDLISTRILEIPPRGDARLRQIASSHIEEFEVLAAAPAVTEYAVMHSGGQRRLLLVTARVDTLAQELALPQAAGLNVVDIIPGPVAAYQGVRGWALRATAPTVVVQVGHEYTEWIVGHGHSLLHLRRIPIGGAALAADDAAVPLRERPTFSRWLEDLVAARRDYDLQYDTASFRPERLAIIGGFPFTRDDQETVAATLDMVPLPWRSGLPEQAASLATAAGLARAGAGRKPIRISLLPPDMKSSALERQQSRYWVAACLMLWATLAVITWHTHHAWSTRRAVKQAVEEEANRLYRMEREWTALQDANEELRQRLWPLRTAQRNNQAATALLHILAKSKGPDDWLVLIADHYTYFGHDAETTRETESSRNAEEEPPRPREMAMRRMVIEGYTPYDDLSSVRAMIERLREYPFLETVDLLPDDKLRPDWVPPVPVLSEWARRFALEIEWSGGGL